jgi:hypothetical protein
MRRHPVRRRLQVAAPEPWPSENWPLIRQKLELKINRQKHLGYAFFIVMF